MKNRFLIFTLLVMLSFEVGAQTTLDDCYVAARDNYPMIRQRELIQQSKHYSLKNVTTAYYPQFGISARATYQSTVTSVPIATISSLPKDQYQVIAEVTQTIWDGGMTRAQKQGIEAAAEAENRRLEVDLYSLKERINNLFFGILILDEQLKITSLLDEELSRNLDKVESYVTSGVANGSDVDAVKVEILNNRQRRAAIESSKTAFTVMLSAMVGFEVGELKRPSVPSFIAQEVNRPELLLFDAQRESAEVQKEMLKTNNTPKLGLFVQGAYGNPGLNMLQAGFTPYAIGGVRLSWNFSALYTNKRDSQKIEVQKMSIESQRDTFLYNTNLQITQIKGEVERLKNQMRDDNEIIALRGNIKRAAQAKVEGGTMSVTDMLREVTAENTAIQNKAIHEMELLMNIYGIKNKMNN